MGLDRDRIVEEALALVASEGLDALNMRALARRLGVRASALYWHVGGRDDLVDRMGAEFYRRAFEAVPPDLVWREWLTAFGQAFRTALLSQRDSAQLCALARPLSEGHEEAAARLAAPLEAAGVPRREALTYIASVISLTLGWAVYEQSSGLHDYLAGLVGFERSYAVGLGALVRGLPEVGC